MVGFASCGAATNSSVLRREVDDPSLLADVAARFADDVAGSPRSRRRSRAVASLSRPARVKRVAASRSVVGGLVHGIIPGWSKGVGHRRELTGPVPMGERWLGPAAARPPAISPCGRRGRP